MIRVLHVVHAITPGGGLSNMIMNYYRFIDREKVQFDFLYFRDSEHTFESEITQLGGRCYRLSEPNMSVSFFKERKKFFKEHAGQWHTIHCHVLFATTFYSKIAKKYGAKHIISHSHSVGYGTGNFVKHIRNRFFVNQAKRLGDIHLACSSDAAKFMFGKNELLSGQAQVLNNAIDLNKYWFNIEKRQNMREKLGVSDKFVIGHIGGFVPLKNHTYLLDVFYEFQKKHPDSILLLIGGEGIANGSTKKQIIEASKKYGIEEKVKILGLRNDVDSLVQAMDVFVFPSTVEGLGIVLVEAQAAGLPCIVSPAIPNEVKILDSFIKMDDLQNIDDWVSATESKIGQDMSLRYVNKNDFKDFDIYVQCQTLEKIYLNGVKG